MTRIFTQLPRLFLSSLLLLLVYTAKGQFIWLTDGGGDDRPRQFIVYPGSKQGVFITGCTYTNPFSFAKLYVVRNSGKTEAELDGTSLSDVKGNPNTITSFITCGYVQDELVFTVEPGTPEGEYDIIIDYNIDGKFDAGVDFIAGDGSDYFFSVTNYQPVITGPGTGIPQDAIERANFLVEKTKSDAGYVAKNLQELYDKYKLGILSLKGLQIAIGVFFSASAKAGMTLVNSVSSVQVVKLGRTLMSPFAAGGSKVGDIAARFAIERYRSIEIDPPRNDYNQIAWIDSVDTYFPNEMDQYPSTFYGEMYSLTSLEQRIAAAQLTTLERLQGALKDGNSNGIYLQLQYLKSLFDLQQQATNFRKQNWINYKSSFSAASLNSTVATDSLQLLKSQLLNEGLTAQQKDIFSFLSWSPEDINSEKQGFISYNLSKLSGRTYNQLFNESIALEDSLLKHINENITLIQDLIEQIETALNLKFPYYTLEGPDNGLVKNAIAFSYKFSKGVTAQSTGGVLYNDEDENINSENFSVTPTEPGYWLFNRSSKNGNFTFVKYHLMNIKPSNQAPVITDHFPKSREININSSDDLLKFRVSATDPEGDPLKYEWFINGNLAGNADSLSLALLTCSNAYYKVLVRVSDTETGNYHSFQEWDVNITGDNALCNNAPSAKNATYWYFGYNSGLRFGGSRPVPLTDGILSNFEGASSMSDTAGNFLFSSDGMKVWNRLHKQMPNGNNLISDPSATQGPLTVPYPGQPDKYILFTVGQAWGGPTDIAYNVINMKLDNGLGDLESKNVKIGITSSEKLAAVYHHNRRHIWVLTHDPLKKRMLAFLVTENGVSHVPVISEFPVPVSNDKGPGYMRFSPDGRTIATANFQSNVDLYDFDNKTGVVSNLRTIQLQNILKGYGSYGIEFSPNNKLLYVADHRGENRIYQLDLSYPTPQEIVNNRFALDASPAALGALQLGPDGRIYVARENMQWLGVINNPNEKGSNSNYVLNGQSLAGKKSSLGLPGFISSVFIRNQIAYSGNCVGMSASFSLNLEDAESVSALAWDFGDGSSSSLLNPEHTYTQPGNYRVKVLISYDGNNYASDSLFTQIEVKPAPIKSLSIKYRGENGICDSLQLSSSAFADGYQWFFNDNPIQGATSMSYWAKQEGTYSLQTSFINGCIVTSSSPVTLTSGKITPVIEQTGNMLTTTLEFKTYQWYLNNQLIQGATARSIVAKEEGIYKVIVSNSQGCTGEAVFEVKNHPDVQYYSKPAGDLHNVLSWGINPDGSGENPPDFGEGKIFNLANRAGNYVMTGNWTVEGTLVNPSGSQLKISGYSLSLTTLTGKGTLTGSVTSGLIIAGNKGGNFGNINFSSGGGMLKSLTLNRIGDGGAAALGTSLEIYDVLTVTSGLLNTNGKLTLKSNEAGTARVAPVTGSISGNVTVERFIPARRAWRLINAPVGGNQTVNQAWQEGATTASSNPNPAPGYGTLITVGTVSNGFDQNKLGQSVSSLKRFTDTGSLQIITNTHTAKVANIPYMLFVRGDRSIIMKDNFVKPNNTTLRATGPLLTGNQTISVGASGFTAVANPFASPINFASITRNNVPNSFYLWDPKMGGTYGVGAYVNISFNGTGYDITPAPISPETQYIQSGQSFLVQSMGTAGSLVIKETDKTATPSQHVFRKGEEIQQNTEDGLVFAPAKNAYGLKLTLRTADGTKDVVLDGVFASYSRDFSDELDHMDALKVPNERENLAIIRRGRQLIVERRNQIQTADTLKLSLTRTEATSYVFEFNPIGLSGMESVTLVDHYLKTETAISLTEASQIFFRIDNENGSNAPDRFSVILIKRKEVLLPEISTEPGIRVYPNPINKNGDLNVQFYQCKEGLYKIDLINNLGQTVFSRIMRLPNGTFNQPISVGYNLPAGVYHMRVTGNDSRYVIKIIVAR